MYNGLIIQHNILYLRSELDGTNPYVKCTFPLSYPIWPSNILMSFSDGIYDKSWFNHIAVIQKNYCNIVTVEYNSNTSTLTILKSYIDLGSISIFSIGY